MSKNKKKSLKHSEMPKEVAEFEAARKMLARLETKCKVLDAINEKVSDYVYLCKGPLCIKRGGVAWDVEMFDMDHIDENAVEHTKVLETNLGRSYNRSNSNRNRIGGDGLLSAVKKDGVEKHKEYLQGLCIPCHAWKTAEVRKQQKIIQTEKRKKAQEIVKCFKDTSTLTTSDSKTSQTQLQAQSLTGQCTSQCSINMAHLSSIQDDSLLKADTLIEPLSYRISRPSNYPSMLDRLSG